MTGRAKPAKVGGMRRVHLFEFEDLPWFPAALRDPLTDLLGKVIEVGRVYHPVVPLLARALQTTGDRVLLDLCSGAGGPIVPLRRLLARCSSSRSAAWPGWRRCCCHRYRHWR